MIKKPHDRSRVIQRNLAIGIGEGVMATPWVFLSMPGGFIVAALLTQYFSLGTAVFGLIVALPALANALQILYLPWVRPFLSPRDMALGPAWLNLGLWVMLAVSLPLLPTESSEDAANIFIIFFLLVSFCSSLIAVGWTTWVQSWVPSSLRGKYFGRRNLFIQTATVCFLLLAMVLLDAGEGQVWPFQALILVAVVMRFISILWQHRIVLPRGETKPSPNISWTKDLFAVWQHRPFRLFIFFMAWIAFWMNSFGPFAIVYAFDFLEFTKGQFARISIVATLAGACMMPLWGRWVDRYGCTRMIALSLVPWWLTGYVWAFLTPATAWILYLMFLVGGALSGGFLIGVFNLLYKVLPQGRTTAGISLNMALSSAAAAVAPVMVGTALAVLQQKAVDYQLVYRALFVISTTMVLLSLIALRRVPETVGRVPERFRLGAMRAIRANMMAVGLAFVTNTNLMRRRKHKEDED
jgi:Na+/melibiose symporter-like transporter